MRQALIVVVGTEQPDLREAATWTARDIARIGIFADVARDIVPIGLIAHAARVARLIMPTLGPALMPLSPSALGRGALHVRVPGLGISVVR